MKTQIAIKNEAQNAFPNGRWNLPKATIAANVAKITPQPDQIADIEINNSGISIVRGVTKAGVEWLESHCNFESWQGNVQGGIACEPNLARAIANDAENDGLCVA